MFKIQCKAHLVFNHLQPKPATETPSSSDTSKDKEKEQTTPTETWERLDSIVLQWIYSTISTDLLHTVLKPNTTAYEAWTTIANIFQDNKATRTIDLNNKFANTHLDQFPNMSAYCQALKVIFDQLSNLGSPVTDEQLVLQLLSGLTEQYENTASVIQQMKPLPDFYDTRSRLCMAESRKLSQARHSAQSAGTALTATTESRQRDDRDKSEHREQRTEYSDRGRARGRGRGRGGRGRNGGGRGRGGYGYSGTGNTQSGSNNFSTYPTVGGYYPWPCYPTWAGPHVSTPHSQWATWNPIPPCPYPTVNKPSNNNSPGILGPRPPQHMPTDLNHAMYAMSLTDPSWAMDTGATGSQDSDPYPTMQ
ncbi:putative RNA-directed DNA polymerase [Helianthus annuus]|nr:putative RNA-directed DNA polymerase [Helianthus annuus]